MALLIVAAPMVGLTLAETRLMQGSSWSLSYWWARFGVEVIHLYLTGLLSVSTIHIVLSSTRGGMPLLAETGAAVAPRAAPLALFTIIYHAPTLLPIFATLPSAISGAGYPPYAMIGLAGLLSFCLELARMLWLGVSTPVFAEERLGFFAVFRRAAALLDGRRWSFLRAWIPILMVSLAMNGAVQLVARAFRVSLIGHNLIVFAAVLYALFGLINGVFIAVCYRELRQLKDGSANQIAELFD
jgi:hypothetical protein